MTYILVCIVLDLRCQVSPTSKLKTVPVAIQAQPQCESDKISTQNSKSIQYQCFEYTRAKLLPL